jgi:hypothetical protein
MSVGYIITRINKYARVLVLTAAILRRIRSMRENKEKVN